MQRLRGFAIYGIYDDAGATNPGIVSVYPAWTLRAAEVAKKMTMRK